MGGTLYTRREALGMAASAAFAGLAAPALRPTRFGVIADVHHGLALDTEKRLETFIEACAGRDLDFIIQLGDFNHPVRAARGFLNVWMNWRGPRYGVLGNHDMDMGTKQDALDLWQLPSRYYAFDAGRLRFVVLDANNILQDGKYSHYESGNYYIDGSLVSYVDDEQLDWFAGELFASAKPVVLFVHQPIDETWHGGTCQNRHRVRAIIEEANRRAGYGKVVACFAGHHHDDGYEQRGGVHYFRVNSASYLWVGDPYGRMAHYDKSLYTFVSVTDHDLTIEGCDAAWVPPTPTERGVPEAGHYVPRILPRRVAIG